jgi:hypothetical protein
LSEIDKWSIIEFDGLTREARLSERPLGQKLGEVLSKELLFDIGMDAADILFPGAGIAIKVAKAVIEKKR